MTQYIFHSNCYSNKECEHLINYFEQSTIRFKKNPTNYEGVVTSLSEHKQFTETLIFQINEYVNIHTFLKNVYAPWTICENFHIQKYLPGECYHAEHMEHGNEEPYSLRLLAWMVYLNTIEDCGGTKWPQQNFESKAIMGDLYIWPAGWTHSHYGIPSSETKYIATGWCSFVSG